METSSLICIGGGVAIGIVGLAFLAKKIYNKKPPKDSLKSEKEQIWSILSKEISPNPNLIKAKKAFINHLDEFTSLLPSLQSGADMNKWTEAIVNINDKDLTSLWANCVKTKDFKMKWLQLLASWQIKSDTCKSFTCVSNGNMVAYSLPDGSPIEMNQKYKVISPCWVFTSEDDYGKSVKRIIMKGVVVQIPIES